MPFLPCLMQFVSHAQGALEPVASQPQRTQWSWLGHNFPKESQVLLTWAWKDELLQSSLTEPACGLKALPLAQRFCYTVSCRLGDASLPKQDFLHLWVLLADSGPTCGPPQKWARTGKIKRPPGTLGLICMSYCPWELHWWLGEFLGFL